IGGWGSWPCSLLKVGVHQVADTAWLPRERQSIGSARRSRRPRCDRWSEGELARRSGARKAGPFEARKGAASVADTPLFAPDGDPMSAAAPGDQCAEPTAGITAPGFSAAGGNAAPFRDPLGPE